MDSIRVLYVEDDPTDQDLTLRYLRRHAHELEVQSVGTGHEAREIVAGQRFGLILLDYRLPDVEGLQLLQELQTDFPNLPVVMVTSPGEGQGSTFTVTLPLQPPRTQGRVLLMEEDAQLGAQIAVTLQKAGFGVDLVGDGEAEQVPPDMVILDLTLSGLPGLKALRRLHAEEFPHLPTLVLVTRAGDPVQEALVLGAEAFLVKPISLGLLTDAVKRLLGRGEAEGGFAGANTNTVH